MRLDFAPAWSLDDVTASLPPQRTLPLMLVPSHPGLDVSAWLDHHTEECRRLLTKHGALLFRRFGIGGANDFDALVTRLCSPPLPYRERSSPRTQVSGNIYTSTDYPADQPIFLHNEQSYNMAFCQKIAFYCERAAGAGGETPIADCRRVFERIPTDLRQGLVDRGYAYVRNYHPGVGLPWQTVYQTQDEAGVAAYCQANDIQFEWRQRGRTRVLRTSQVRRVAGLHPESGAPTWMNHLTFFHLSTLPVNIQRFLLELYGEDSLPNHTFYGDGASIPPAVMEALRVAYLEESVAFGWEPGDVMVLDNMLTAHGRAPYTGHRRVLTAMASPRSWADVRPVA
jgi:alpha-ketoglutarate-dependent taurine dioxygenase